NRELSGGAGDIACPGQASDSRQGSTDVDPGAWPDIDGNGADTAESEDARSEIQSARAAHHCIDLQADLSRGAGEASDVHRVSARGELDVSRNHRDGGRLDQV